LPRRQEEIVTKVTTTCPSCGTSFRVTPQQLAARQGQVRCGHCNVLFNGLETVAMADKVAPQMEFESEWGDLVPNEPAAHNSNPEAELRLNSPPPQPLDDGDAPVLYHPDFSPGRGGNSTLWLTGSALLLVLLLAQGTIYFRDIIAREMPGFKPFLSAYCDVLGCRITMPRDADLITIESSDLKQFPDRPNEIAFAALLRNRAAYAQEFPALELTLTDAAGQAMVKRFIQPPDYITDKARIGRGIAPLEEVNVALRVETKEVVAVGYRLVIFYP
jgi:predicted Zn finger-like uncharacterized protein